MLIYTIVLQDIEWSLNSEFILCANIKKAIIQVYSVHNPQWKCKLTEGSAGLQNVKWSPDSKCILILADFNVCYSPIIDILVNKKKEQLASFVINTKIKLDIL